MKMKVAAPTWRLACALVPLAWVLLLGSGCDDSASVRSTNPKDGEQDVEATTSVLIRFDTPFSERDDTDPETLAAAVRVNGDLTDGTYQGTVTLQSFQDAKNDPGGGDPGAQPPPPPGNPQAGDPRVTSVTPGRGNVAGGELVTIVVDGPPIAQDRTPTVFFGSRQGSDVEVVSPQSVTAETPASDFTGTVEVSVIYESASGLPPPAQPPAAGDGGDGGDATGGTGGTGVRAGETINAKFGEFQYESNASRRSTGKDTLVFTLDGGETFKLGERIRVHVSHDLKIQGLHIDSYDFDFFISEDTEVVGGDLRVTSTDPSPSSLGVLLRPTVEAEFSRDVDPATVAGNAFIRGDHSGTLELENPLFPGDGSTGKVGLRLAGQSLLLPGEFVTVTLSDGVTASGAADVLLAPHSFRFQATAGRVPGNLWESALTERTGAAPRAVAAGDLMPDLPGVEMVVLSGSQMDLFFQEIPEVWENRRFDRFGDGFQPVDIAVADLDGNGLPEIVALVAGDTGSRIHRYVVSPSGAVGALGTPVEIDLLDPRGLTVVDIDANGHLDLLIHHPSSEQLPGDNGGSAVPVETGTLSVLGNFGAVPLVQELDLWRVLDVIPDLKVPDRLELADLDNDGRPDLAVENEDGITLYRNVGRTAGTRSDRFRFRLEVLLRDALGKEALRPLTWGLADLDGDHDIDILTWDLQGALYYRNSLDPGRTGDDGRRKSARGFFGEKELVPLVVPVSDTDGSSLSGVLQRPLPPRFGDFNGDQNPDVWIADAEAGLSLFQVTSVTRGEDEVPELDRLERLFAAPVQLGADLTASTVFDADGDSALDIAVISTGSGEDNLELLRAIDVEAPPVETLSSFRIDPDRSQVTDSEARVVVVGDLVESFNGYRVTLDFEEEHLSFSSFEEPVNFRGLGNFDVCGSEQGCAGFVSMEVQFTNSRGSPGEGVVLGTFIFEKEPVERTERASILLASRADAGGNSLGNTVRITDGEFHVDAPASLEGDPFVVPLEPPPRELLVITDCRVTEMRDTDYSAVVSWSSPADALFSSFDVEINGARVVTLDRFTRTYEFIATGVETQNIRVVARGLSGDVLATAECAVAGLLRPQVTCEHDAPGNRNLIFWSVQGEPDGFFVYKNGSTVPVATLAGDVSAVIDNNPSPTGGDIYEVAGFLRVGGTVQEGPRGICEGGPVGDPTIGTTEAPFALSINAAGRSTPGDPNSLAMRWNNGEGYEAVVVKLFVQGQEQPLVTEQFDRPVSRFTYDADPETGGVPPQIYEFSVQGFVNGLPSSEVRSLAAPVPVPPLNVGFSCATFNGNSVRLTWARPWQGYDALSLKWVRREDGTIVEDPPAIPLDFESTELVLEELAPIGQYEFQLRATYDRPLPPALAITPEALREECIQVFRPNLRLGLVESGIGLGNVQIPIHGDLFGTLTGFSCTVRVPTALALDAEPVRVNHPSARVASLELRPGSEPETRDISFRVTGAEFAPGLDVGLATIVGSIGEGVSLAKSYPLRFQDTPNHEYPGVGSVEVQGVDEAGELLVHKRFVIVEKVSAVGGSSRPVAVRVFTTFDNPPGINDYRLLGLTLHLRFDAELLELQPISRLDQLEMELGKGGELILPEGPVLDATNVSGDLKLAWIGLLGENAPYFVRPGVNIPLLTLKFLPRLPRNPAGEDVRIEVVKPPDRDQPTQFVPVDIPNDGPALSAWFDGVVSIEPPEDIPTLLEIDPTRGSLVGGGEALLSGFAMTAGVENPGDLRMSLVRRAVGRDPVIRELLPAGEPSGNLIRVLIPSAGPEFYKPVFSSVAFDVELFTPSGRSILAGAYRYDYLRVASADISSGSPAGGDRMEIEGAGISPDVHVLFHVDGGDGQGGTTFEVERESIQVADDGSQVVFQTPAMTGHGGKLAMVEVVVPIPEAEQQQAGIAEISDILTTPFLLSDEPAIRSIEPGQGSLGGGTEVLLVVSGFVPDVSGASTVQVFFGEEEAEVRSASQNEIRVLTPAALTAGRVDVRVIRGTTQAVGFDIFEYLDTLAIVNVEPDAGSICGGESITISGSGFQEGMKVRLGTTEVESVQFISGGEVQIVTPTVPESVRAVAVAVSVDGTNFVEWNRSFLFTDVSFIRGDVDGSGRVNVSDAVLLGRVVSGTVPLAEGQTRDVLDVNDDGVADARDQEALSRFLFQGSSLPAPFPQAGVDPTPDGLTSCSP